MASLYCFSERVDFRMSTANYWVPAFRIHQLVAWHQLHHVVNLRFYNELRVAQIPFLKKRKNFKLCYLCISFWEKFVFQFADALVFRRVICPENKAIRQIPRNACEMSVFELVMELVSMCEAINNRSADDEDCSQIEVLSDCGLAPPLYTGDCCRTGYTKWRSGGGASSRSCKDGGKVGGTWPFV